MANRVPKEIAIKATPGDVASIQATYGRKVVLPNGRTLNSTWYTAPDRTAGGKLQSAYTPTAMEQKAFKNNESTFRREMKARGRPVDAPKRKGEVSRAELDAMQAANGRKVKLPNGKVLTSTWYAPAKLDGGPSNVKAMDAEYTKWRNNPAERAKALIREARSGREMAGKFAEIRAAGASRLGGGVMAAKASSAGAGAGVQG